eukprot:scaffold11826_cov68-Isochrysis_galbana.AAC.1
MPLFSFGSNASAHAPSSPPTMQARCNAVSPLPSAKLGSAPAARHSSTRSRSAFRAAAWSSPVRWVDRGVGWNRQDHSVWGGGERAERVRHSSTRSRSALVAAACSRALWGVMQAQLVQTDVVCPGQRPLRIDPCGRSVRIRSQRRSW